jgi:hypothetical protein
MMTLNIVTFNIIKLIIIIPISTKKNKKIKEGESLKYFFELTKF